MDRGVLRVLCGTPLFVSKHNPIFGALEESMGFVESEQYRTHFGHLRTQFSLHDHIDQRTLSCALRRHPHPPLAPPHLGLRRADRQMDQPHFPIDFGGVLSFGFAQPAFCRRSPRTLLSRVGLPLDVDPIDFPTPTALRVFDDDARSGLSLSTLFHRRCHLEMGYASSLVVGIDFHCNEHPFLVGGLERLLQPFQNTHLWGIGRFDLVIAQMHPRDASHQEENI